MATRAAADLALPVTVREAEVGGEWITEAPARRVNWVEERVAAAGCKRDVVVEKHGGWRAAFVGQCPSRSTGAWSLTPRSGLARMGRKPMFLVKRSLFADARRGRAYGGNGTMLRFSGSWSKI